MHKVTVMTGVCIMISACTWFSVEEYVTATVDNRTAESLTVQTGEDLISFKVGAASAAVHQVVKSKPLTAKGDATGTTFGPRTFTADGQVWIIYD